VIFTPTNSWSAGDVRAQLGQGYTKHQEALEAFSSKYILLDKMKHRAMVKELNVRGAEHKESFNENGILPSQYWLNDRDIKLLAILWGVSFFVVSTEALKVSVLKYLPSVSAPGSVCINLKDMDLPDKARGESAVYENDIVMLYNGAHYNVLTWPLTPDDDGDETTEMYAECHFADQFGD
jgi:hypothetical protein